MTRTHGTGELVDVNVARSSISALRDEAREYGRMPFKVRDLHVSLLHRALDELERRQREEGSHP